MKIRMCLAMMAVALCLPTARAVDVGAFASMWDRNDGDAVGGVGASLLLELLPIEFRATYYQDASVPDAGDVSALPIDAGFTTDLTRTDVIDLFFGVGGSYYFLDADHGDPDNEFGWYADARLEVPLEGALSLFGGVIYRGIDVGDIDTDLSGFAYNVGVIFR